MSEDILSRTVRHQVWLTQVANQEARLMLDLLDDELFNKLRLDADLSALSRSRSPMKTKRYGALRRRLAERFSKAEAAMREQLRLRLVRLGLLEAEWQIKLLAETVPLSVSWATPAIATIRAAVSSSPFDGEILRDWTARWSRAARGDILRVINRGLLAGDDVLSITRALLGDPAASALTGNSSRAKATRAARTLVRTATNHIANQARQATFEENRSLIKAVRWVATLDARTTDICASLDGQQWPVLDGPRPPAHHQCRSTVVPITKTWKELGLNAKSKRLGGRNARDVESGLSGVVGSRITYGTWLKRQPAKVQDQVLGPARGKLLRSGQVKFDRFFDDGRRLTLRKLAQREGLDFDGIMAKLR